MKFAAQIAIVAAVFIAALAVLCAWAKGEIPRSTHVRDWCESVETNYVFDDMGEQRLVQLVFRDTDRIIAWKMPRPIPSPERTSGGYRFTFVDGDVLRVVECRSWFETFTQHDREVEERAWFPQEYRRGLTPQVRRAKP